jgi:DNA topoisomerase-1
VNDYLREAAATDVTAKDFRTWVATVSAAAALAGVDPPTSATEERTLVNEAIAAVAKELGNTPAVCRASYIHPKVLADFGSGTLQEDWASPPRRRAGLTIEERRTLVVLGGRTRRRRSRHAAAA